MQSWNRLFSFLCVAFLAASLTSCLEDECSATRTYTIWEPVYMEIDDIRKDIEMEEPRELKNPGNIYFYQDYILINEIEEGIHIIDNANPSNPQNLAFVKVPGSRDMAIRNDVLYVDNYIDLLSIDVSNPKQPTLIDRCEDVFIDYYYYSDLGYIVNYEPTQLMEEVECGENEIWNDWLYE